VRASAAPPSIGRGHWADQLALATGVQPSGRKARGGEARFRQAEAPGKGGFQRAAQPPAPAIRRFDQPVDAFPRPSWRSPSQKLKNLGGCAALQP